MNYLANNLNNSLALPSDVMRIIYEYADPFTGIRKQIENKVHNLEYIFKTFKICGLNTLYRCSYRQQIIKDIQITNSKFNFKKYSTKKLYKKWLKL